MSKRRLYKDLLINASYYDLVSQLETGEILVAVWSDNSGQHVQQISYSYDFERLGQRDFSGPGFIYVTFYADDLPMGSYQYYHSY